MTGDVTATLRPVPRWRPAAAAWLRESRGGLFVIALVVGVGSGLAVVVFWYLIYFFSWLATGQGQFGQDGRSDSSHLPWLGLGFIVLIPAIGGLVYGPLIYRLAREARGHGVPQVLAAVAERGGRIRPQVSAVKAVASAMCIGVGGSVGREGPIVQIGSGLASGLGQWVKVPEKRMRILIACGAAGGISATFNTPVTGVFFGVEIITREFSVDAMFAVVLSAMLAEVVAVPILGGQRFLHGLPARMMLPHPADYLLVAVLGVAAGVIGVVFFSVLHSMEDVWDRAWQGRPEWARPAIGGLALGLVLLALPQMYGVGDPVMYKALAGNYVLWFLLVLAAGKILACSLTLGIGGSGGVFGPSLFIGVTSGMAFGDFASHAFGAAAGPPALYAVVSMGAVFASAAGAPLTAVACVAEMTGDYALTLPVMLAVAIAAAVSRGLSYGTIYTTKLLRRGADVERAAPWRAFGDLKTADAMRPFPVPHVERAHQDDPGNSAGNGTGHLPAPVTCQCDSHVVYAGESLAQTLRRLQAHGRDGLPVLSDDGLQVRGWITAASVLRAVAVETGAATQPGPAPARGRERAVTQVPAGQPDPARPAAPQPGYQVIEVTVGADSPAVGQPLGSVCWPGGSFPVSVLREHSLHEPDPRLIVAPGDQVSLVAPVTVPTVHPQRAKG
jgi:chloride channel protein, CIC family